MLHSKLKRMCREAWSERFNYLCFIKSKREHEGKYRIFSESKNIYIECICKSEAF